MDAEHLAKGILEVARLHVTVQHVLQHVQEGRVEILHLDFALGLQPQGRGRAVVPRALVHALLGGNDLGPLVDGAKPLAEDCMQPQEQIPVVVGEEQRVGFLL